MKDLRIVFMGTPEFAVQTLQEILDNGFLVVGVVTAPDKPAGRGRKLSISAVKDFALQNNIPVLQPTNLKSEEFYKQLVQLAPNLQVIVAFRMLPKKIWQLPELGTINLHASLLPQYRGAAPINWALIHGETKTGVSTFFIDEKIDTGKIILQEETEISETENAGELHDTLKVLGAKLIVKTLFQIESEKIVAMSQEKENTFKEAPKLTPENTRIDWDKKPTEIINLIRGLSPYPGAWSLFKDSSSEFRIKIFKAKISYEIQDFQPGIVFQKEKELHVSLKNKKSIVLEELQFPGKRKMTTKELLNGFQLKEKSCVS